jgi:hypothetical protein
VFPNCGALPSRRYSQWQVRGGCEISGLGLLL